MPTATIQGVTTHYLEKGEPHASVIVLLHGFPLSSMMWAAQIDALAERWRVVAPDFRGFGQSGGDGPASIEQLADDAHQLARSLKVPGGRFVLAGLSMGGYVAIAYARKYPQTLRGLILLDTKAEPDDAEGKANRDRMISIVNEKGVKPIADAMLGKLIPEEAARNRPQLVRQLRQMMESTPPQAIAGALAAMRDRPDQTAALGSIAVPTLIVVGDQDAVTPPEVARQMQQKIPGSRLKLITASGHMSPMEQPAQVNAAMEQFLKDMREG
jgi:3-oxoadipate enol-lactonase